MTELSQRSRGWTWPWMVVTVLAIAMACVFGTGNHFGSDTTIVNAQPATTRLAAALVETGMAPEISDETLEGVVQAVMKRAAEGDIEAAAFVAELAAAQRKPAEKGAAKTTAPKAVAQQSPDAE